MTRDSLRARLDAVHAEIAAATARAGRSVDDVTLVVVTKTAPPSIFGELAALGVRDVGENRIQDAAQRMAGHEHDFRWHFIGHLQSNKVRRAVPLFDVFHGVDSLELVQRLERVAGELGRRPELLLQVNVSGEASKSGLPPEAVPEVLAASRELLHARVKGLMTMAPLVDDPEQARPVFAGLAALARRCSQDRALDLSMGMTDDFAVAVEEGATLVRIGRRIVGPSELA